MPGLFYTNVVMIYVYSLVAVKMLCYFFFSLLIAAKKPMPFVVLLSSYINMRKQLLGGKGYGFLNRIVMLLCSFLLQFSYLPILCNCWTVFLGTGLGSNAGCNAVCFLDSILFSCVLFCLQ